MRLLELGMLRSGMVLGKTIYSASGQILLQKGILLSDAYIAGIRKTNCSGVYIDDEFSKDIEIKDVVSEQLRHETVNKIKGLFTTIQGTTNIAGVSKSMVEVNELLKGIVDQVLSNRTMVVNMIDLKTYDDYTYQHSVNVSVLATVLGIASGYNQKALLNLATAGLFHDIGKMFVNKDILNKPSRFTQEEFEEMKKHPSFGFEFSKKTLNFSGETLIGILHHHEKYDGTGYPNGKAQDEIHKNAQIVAIADVFDAMTSRRVYHEPILPSEAIEYVMGTSGQHFAPAVAEVFLRKVAAYPVGICVELSNGIQGLVCENYEGMTMRPKVKVMSSDGDYFINLADMENTSVTIVKIIKSISMR